MSEPDLDAVFAQAWLTLDELCRQAAVEPAWVRAHVEEGLLPAPRLGAGGIGPRAWRFDGLMLLRVRRLRALERDFDAVPELAALVADLQEELERMRARLARAGLAP